jgi:hypothetical protein
MGFTNRPNTTRFEKARKAVINPLCKNLKKAVKLKLPKTLKRSTQVVEKLT